VKNILIPVEKDSEENTTIDRAVEIAKKFDSKITLLNVDNSEELLVEVNKRRSIDDGRMLKRLGDHGLVDESDLPGATAKDNVKGKQKYNLEDDARSYNKETLEDEYKQNENFNSNAFLDEMKELYEKEGIEVDTIVLEGDPASAILDEAEKGDYDLVIMKTHTMKKRKRFMLGSVTNKVVHHINIPILIIR